MSYIAKMFQDVRISTNGGTAQVLKHWEKTAVLH